MKIKFKGLALVLPLALSAPLFAVEQGNDADKFAAYRAALAEDNPGEFWVEDGKALFHKKRGPKNASLEKCDFGLGEGVLKGAFAQMPRYFKDTGRVETLEGRLVTCMTTLQGFKEDDILKPHYVNAGEEDSRVDELTQLTSYVAAQSNGMPFAIKLSNDAEKHSYELGKMTFFRRMGAMDLSCANCHGPEAKGRTIRGVELPILTDTKSIGPIMAAFPAYVLKDANMRTPWWRNERCILAMRLPWLKTGSEIDAALTMFMGYQASQDAAKIQIPGLKPRA
ncbi:MAG: sulfur oxidation c-type cytochrome SoxA [Halothiobacillaceae bacterium]